MSGTCPDCDHPKSQHSFVGCMAVDADLCDCLREFPEHAKATSPERTEAEKTEAMAKAERGTDPDWEAEATKVVRHLALRGRDFTPDDVWVELEHRQVPPPREPRALGPILKRMANADEIRAKGFTESGRRHGAPVRIYEAGPVVIGQP